MCVYTHTHTRAHTHTHIYIYRLPWWFSGKKSDCNAGDLGSIPRLGRSSGGRHGNPLQYSCLENPKDRGAWWATVQGVAKKSDMTEQLRPFLILCLW